MANRPLTKVVWRRPNLVGRYGGADTPPPLRGGTKEPGDGLPTGSKFCSLHLSAVAFNALAEVLTLLLPTPHWRLSRGPLRHRNLASVTGGALVQPPVPLTN